MKYTNKLLTFAALLSLLIAVGCKKDKKNDPDPQPILGEELVGTWAAVQENAISVPGDNADVLAQFADFTITIAATESAVSYTTNSEDPIIFPTSGTFTVEASDNFGTGAEIARQDGVVVNARVAGNVLTLVFTIDTSTGGIKGDNARVMGIDGEYTFILDKQ